jgi:hypothetical protein
METSPPKNRIITQYKDSGLARQGRFFKEPKESLLTYVV